jgi:hypothetical protein
MKKQVIPSLTLLVTGAGLGVYAFMGVFGRMFTDDYCYSYSYQTLGLLGTLKGYYFITTFTAHRYALTMFEWLIDRFGIPGIQWMPLGVLAIWGVGIYLLFREMNRRIEQNWSMPEMAAISALLLFFSVYLAPNMYQSLYWRTGVLPYSAPLIAGLWLLVYLFMSQRPKSPIRTLLLGSGAFLAAGFSEAGAVFICGLFALVIVWTLWMGTKGHRTPWLELGQPALVVILTIAAALVIMYLSPVNVQRQASYDKPATVVTTLVSALRFAIDFMWLSIRTQPLPNLIFCLLGGAMAFLSSQIRGYPFQKIIRFSASVGCAALFLIWVIHLPSAYVEKAPPAERTLIMARFTFLSAELLVSYAIGGWLRSILPGRRWMSMAATALLALGWLYIIRAGFVILQNDVPRLQKVAEVWDARDRQLRLAQLDGQTVVQVQPIDSQYIGGLLELYPSPNWVNICAAQYYGVEEIQATLSW